MNITFEDQRHLVIHVIKKTFGGVKNAEEIAKRRSMDKEDLIQVGEIALWESIERFDKSKGFAFSTFACAFIRGRLLQETERKHIIKVPRGMDKKLKEEIANILSLQKDISNNGEPTTIQDFLASDYNLEDEVITKIESKRYISSLSKNELQVLDMRMKKYSFKEISKTMGISAGAAECAHRRAQKKIKKELIL